jgi:hypothetical protein
VAINEVTNRGGAVRPFRLYQYRDAWGFPTERADLLGFIGELDSARPFELALEENETEESIPWSYGHTDRLGHYTDAYVVKQELKHTREQWLAQLGYYPAQRLNLTAFCNSAIDHQLLAHLALHLTERYEGLVDMNGALRPPVRLPSHLRGEASRAEVMAWRTSAEGQEAVHHPPLEEVAAYIQQLPGQVYTFTYDLWDGRPWVWHVLDLTAFRAWMQHPNFYMMK